MREEIVEPFFQSVWISVWLLYVKRGTVFFALCSTFRRVILFPCSLAEGKTAHSCFAVRGIAPSRRLNARDLIFQELIKSDCDLQAWFQSHDGWIHSAWVLPCDSPSSSCPQSKLFHSRSKTWPGLYGSTWKDVLKGTGWREVSQKQQSYVAKMLSNASRYLDTVINIGGKMSKQAYRKQGPRH